MATASTSKGRGGKRPGAGRKPGSRNKATLAREADARTLTELAREKTEVALATLERIATDTTAPAAAQVAAAVALLDRAWGRPAQRLAVEEDPGPERGRLAYRCAWYGPAMRTSRRWHEQRRNVLEH